MAGDLPAESTLRHLSTPAHSRSGGTDESYTEDHDEFDQYSRTSDYASTELVGDSDYLADNSCFVTADELFSDASLPTLEEVLAKAAPSQTSDRDESGAAIQGGEGETAPCDGSEPDAEGDLCAEGLNATGAGFDAPDEAGDDDDAVSLGSESEAHSDALSVALQDPVTAQEYHDLAAQSDDMGPPAARTSDMENWTSPYDEMREAIARINGPYI